MKAIIIAAGIGSRLGDLTKDLPKPLIDVNGKSILERQIELFKKFGINEIFIITGYKNDKIKFSDINCVYNSEYQQTEQIGSLMKARNEISGDVIISFGDILFEEKILEELLENKDDFVLVSDPNWKKSYESRPDNPPTQSDFIALKNNKIIKFFKNSLEIDNSYSVVEFIGLMKMSTTSSNIFLQKYNNLEKSHTGKFHFASSFMNAKFIDFFEELRLSGIQMYTLNVNGKWCEIDTIQDLEIAKKLFI
ncbi:phosphocholine cytidylyltransferase family protein [Candidatus Nitrosopelagicus sp.]|nr:phosphocholine cytidylyltransferase family protein [Candidatus Nitrosopelagicus sp.]